MLVPSDKWPPTQVIREIETPSGTLRLGDHARFFHPMTMGVMHPGVVKRIHEDGEISVKFSVDGKVHKTVTDHF